MTIVANVNIKINKDIIDKIETKAKRDALEKTAVWVLGEVIASGKVPKLTGALEGAGAFKDITSYVSVISDGLVKIIFDTPYARRWYFNTEGVTFRKEYNAHAQDHWMDDFIYGVRKDEMVQMFFKFLEEEIEGII